MKKTVRCSLLDADLLTGATDIEVIISRLKASVFRRPMVARTDHGDGSYSFRKAPNETSMAT
ncbi:hypothetical protein O9992_27810 [Vibrio lentus]|nr:hypothetical protein [Vibrio lentus]